MATSGSPFSNASEPDASMRRHHHGSAVGILRRSTSSALGAVTSMCFRPPTRRTRRPSALCTWLRSIPPRLLHGSEWYQKAPGSHEQKIMILTFYLQIARKKRADERTRTAYPCSSYE
jgi:hypothetical protein